MSSLALMRRVARRRRPRPPQSPETAFAVLIVVASIGLYCFGRAYGHPYGRAPVEPVHALGALYWACGIVALLASWCDARSDDGRRTTRRLLTLGAGLGGVSLLILAALSATTVAAGASATTAAFSVAAAATFAVHVRGFLQAASRT
ncbi:MAG TPA: hypothetical protein VEA81_14195 [Burkholderiaceae bacterium]|nr:hypothetical protein [Burkholderiaceae bacterium]